MADQRGNRFGSRVDMPQTDNGRRRGKKKQHGHGQERDVTSYEQPAGIRKDVDMMDVETAAEEPTISSLPSFGKINERDVNTSSAAHCCSGHPQPSTAQYQGAHVHGHTHPGHPQASTAQYQGAHVHGHTHPGHPQSSTAQYQLQGAHAHGHTHQAPQVPWQQYSQPHPGVDSKQKDGLNIFSASSSVCGGAPSSKSSKGWGLRQWLFNSSSSQAQDEDSESYGHSQSFHQHQVQSQASDVRSVQATTQMVYDVFEWTLSSIETLEKMQNEEAMEREGYDLSEASKPFYQRMIQSNRTPQEMIEQCNTYLVILRTQLSGLRKDMETDIRCKLLGVGGEWLHSGLDETNGGVGQAGYFKNELISMLQGNKPKMMFTSLEAEQQAKQESTPETRSECFRAMQHGMTQTEELDENFRKEPTRQAELKDFRKPQFR